MDIDALISPLSDESAAGPDMGYDSVRQEIEAAFDRSISVDSEEQADFDWAAITRLIERQATETRDIWLAIYLMRAGAKSGALDTVEAGANLLAGLLESLWDSVHPQLEEYGFQGRGGACEALTRVGEFIGPLRNVVLIEHSRLGSYSGADFERFRDRGDSEDGYGMFRALLEETSDENLQAVLDRIDGITDSIRRADSVLTANSGSDTSTNFQPTYEALGVIRKAVKSFQKSPTSSEPEDGYISESNGIVGENQTSGSGFGGAVNSREDVLKALDAIAAYYRKKEPGSPVPFVLRRARDWVSLDFLEVLEDIAPNSLDEARRVLTNGRNSNGSDGWSSVSDDSWSSNSEE